ncbi:MAG TPA: hypothetical protein VFG23_04750 [Polyangia bacterium]|nr:hypothetical protein [Polyangia bacterium]
MGPRIGILLAVALAGCSAGMANRSRTSGELHDCQADDFATGHAVFFGLSNLGPGTVMRRQGGGKGVCPEYLVERVTAHPRSTVVHLGVDWNCALGDSLARTFNANRAVGMLPVDPRLNAQLARASRVGVTADSVRWDDLLTAPYQTAVDRLNDGGLKADLLGGRYWVVSRALAATGIKITVGFDQSIGAGVKAALGDGPKNLQEGKVAARVNLAWKGTTELVITALSEVYIAGQFKKLGASSSSPTSEIVSAVGSSWQTLQRTGG